MSYRAPLADILFALKHQTHIDASLYPDLADGAADAMLEEAGRMAEQVWAPLNTGGDRAGATWRDGVVTTSPGWANAYKTWCDGGWNGVTASADFGGMGLPYLFDAACAELWSASNMALGLCPLLTSSAISLLEKHASAELKARYLAKLVAGTFTATMNLTEPQAGSDVGALTTKAVARGDGTYAIAGTKIYITYGEHDMTENIVHLVLARLPGAPSGNRGISLFLVPKVLEDGRRNDVRCSAIEHKLGIHGSPTCTMIYGDDGGATGWLVGAENEGLGCMFTMMNHARLNVALQGVGVADRATQLATAYARDRKQGRATGAKVPSPIIEHPDVRRMLATMRALTAAARAMCFMTAEALDAAEREPDVAARKRAADRAALLTPIAKAFATDIGIDVASLGVQVHGGMGFVEETGAAQLLRDVRIAAIYEGTNGIQAVDLVRRKLSLGAGTVVSDEIAAMRAIVRDVRGVNAPQFGRMGQRLDDAVDALERATRFMLDRLDQSVDEALVGATPYLRLFAYARGGTALAKGALAAHEGTEDGQVFLEGQIAVARFFAEQIACGASGLETAIVDGFDAVGPAALPLAS